jgi:hypothetical protein
LNGAVVQLVRAPACHAGSCEFESRQSRPNGGRTEHLFNDRFLSMGILFCHDLCTYEDIPFMSWLDFVCFGTELKRLL